MTQAPAPGTCATCKFWAAPAAQPEGRDAPAHDFGRCHFSAPIVLIEMEVQTFWPKTLGTDWCGQFVALP